jgi:transcriptional regulator with XRE-family HTH domain
MPTRKPTKIVERLKAALESKKGATQAGIAKACGKSRASVSEWFSGETNAPTAENLAKAADYLGVDFRWLATGEGDMRGSVKGYPKYMRETLGPIIIGLLRERSTKPLQAEDDVKAMLDFYENLVSSRTTLALPAPTHPEGSQRAGAARSRGNVSSDDKNHG